MQQKWIRVGPKLGQLAQMIGALALRARSIASFSCGRSRQVGLKATLGVGGVEIRLQ